MRGENAATCSSRCGSAIKTSSIIIIKKGQPDEIMLSFETQLKTGVSHNMFFLLLQAFSQLGEKVKGQRSLEGSEKSSAFL